MIRLLLAVLSLAVLHACASPVPSAGGATPGSMPGVSERIGTPAACVAEMQSCKLHADCCSGMACMNSGGRYGMLCQRPNPN